MNSRRFYLKCCELKQRFPHVWPDHHWQCNWRVACPSSSMYAGKRRTLQATIVTIFSHMMRHFCCLSNVTWFLDFFFRKLPQFHTSNLNFCKVVRQHTEDMVGSIILVLLRIYLAFQQWKNFENPLRIDKVITMSLVYYFFGTQCIRCITCVELMVAY